jgi:hypothetical protein
MAQSKDNTLHGLTRPGSVGETEDERRKMTAWNSARSLEDSSDRLDCDGRVICWKEYGKTTAYGWEVDRATHGAIGGLDVQGNLRARHWLGSRGIGGLPGGSFRPANPDALQASRTS